LHAFYIFFGIYLQQQVSRSPKKKMDSEWKKPEMPAGQIRADQGGSALGRPS
jgi:hypothetical protein